MTRTSAPPSGDARSATSRGPDVLVARRGELLDARQVHPELDPVEQPAADDERLGRLLDVEDPGPGSHPLGVAVGDDAAAAVRVGVLERAVHHVRHGLEPAVRVPRRSLRLAGRVLDLAHLVHVDERVEIGEVDTLERAPDGEPLALVALRRRRHRADGTLAHGLRVGLRDARQDRDVGDGDGWHALGLVVPGGGLADTRIVAGATIVKRGPPAAPGEGRHERDSPPDTPAQY